MSNANFLSDLLEASKDDPIEFIKFNKLLDNTGWPGIPDPRNKNIDPTKLYTFEDAKPLLDYTYNSDYGSPDCHPIIAWSKNRVYYIHEYDGATWVEWVERNSF